MAIKLLMVSVVGQLYFVLTLQTRQQEQKINLHSCYRLFKMAKGWPIESCELADGIDQ